MTFPGVNFDKACKLLLKVSERAKFDNRMHNTLIFHEDDESVFFYSRSPKSNFASQREYILEQFKIQQDGKQFFVGVNRVHPSKPIDDSYYGHKRMFFYLFGQIIEPLDP
jgi:hypothetical protein